MKKLPPSKQQSFQSPKLGITSTHAIVKKKQHPAKDSLARNPRTQHRSIDRSIHPSGTIYIRAHQSTTQSVCRLSKLDDEPAGDVQEGERRRDVLFVRVPALAHKAILVVLRFVVS